MGISVAKGASTLRIMPLGDSITAGYTDNPTWSVPFGFGYRSGLYSRLSSAGYSFQFVGSSLEPWVSAFGAATTVSASVPDLRPLGQDYHHGYGAWGTASILDKIDEWMTYDTPDMVLLMIGINDIGQGSTTDPVAAKSNLDGIVQKIVAKNANAEVIVAQITPYATFTNAIVQYNTYITGVLVPKYVALGNHVSTVDQYSNLLTNTQIDASLFSNGINHPNATSYDRIANTWFAGIQSVHPIPEPGPLALLGAGLIAVLCYTCWMQKWKVARTKW
jgi:lysophospholipase L1-like esterase